MDMSAEFSLKSAVFYANPRSTSDVLPVVLGDMTQGGSGGLWQIPCIDTVSRVYALAGEPVLSAANGNSVTIYNRDGEALAGYTFNESTNVESNGLIATITFPSKTASTISFSAADNSINDSAAGLPLITNCTVTVSGAGETSNNNTFKVLTATASKWTLDGERSVKDEAAGASITLSADQDQNEPLTARCKGRASGSALISNPISQIEDLIVNLATGGASSDLHGTSLERARAVCGAQGYATAGVIDSNQTLGTLVSTILKGCLGSWWVDPEGKLRLRIDQGPGVFDEGDLCASFPISVTEGASLEADIRNLCTQARVSYAYNWSSKKCESSDEGQGSADSAAAALYGGQIKEFEWPWVRSAAMVHALQAIIVSTFARPVRIYELVHPSFEHIPLVRGDFCLFSSRWMYDAAGARLINQITRLLTLEQDLDARSITFRLADFNLFKTIAYPADGSQSAEDGSLAGSARDLTEY